VIVVVGGNARDVGKTTLVCRLIAALPEREWVAVKVSGHPHGSALVSPLRPKQRATELFLAAGAREAWLLRDTPEDRARLAALVAGGRNVVIESNRAVEWVAFDAYLFVLDEEAREPKERSRWHLERARWVLPARTDPPGEVVAALRELR